MSQNCSDGCVNLLVRVGRFFLDMRASRSQLHRSVSDMACKQWIRVMHELFLGNSVIELRARLDHALR